MMVSASSRSSTAHSQAQLFTPTRWNCSRRCSVQSVGVEVELLGWQGPGIELPAERQGAENNVPVGVSILEVVKDSTPDFLVVNAPVLRLFRPCLSLC
jgi:hypothetical protein